MDNNWTGGQFPLAEGVQTLGMAIKKCMNKKAKENVIVIMGHVDPT